MGNFLLVFYFSNPKEYVFKCFDMFMISLSLSVGEIEFRDIHGSFVWNCAKYFCETSIPTLGRLSFPRMFLSYPSVKIK